jgi:hypothetical protein
VSFDLAEKVRRVNLAQGVFKGGAMTYALLGRALKGLRDAEVSTLLSCLEEEIGGCQ